MLFFGSPKVQIGNFGKLKVHWKITPIMMRSLAKRNRFSCIWGNFKMASWNFKSWECWIPHDTTTLQWPLELRWGGDKHCLWNRVYPWPEWGLEAFFKAHRLAPDQCSLAFYCTRCYNATCFSCFACGYGSLIQTWPYFCTSTDRRCIQYCIENDAECIVCHHQKCIKPWSLVDIKWCRV